MLSARPSASIGMIDIASPFLSTSSNPPLTVLCSPAMRLARPNHLGQGPRPWSSRHQEGKLLNEWSPGYRHMRGSHRCPPDTTSQGVAFKKMPEPESEPPSEDIGTVGMALIALGLPANPICLWSEFTLATTGSGLPEGPGGALGAAGESEAGCTAARITIRTMRGLVARWLVGDICTIVRGGGHASTARPAIRLSV